MKQWGKVLGILIVLALFAGGNLFAEGARQARVEDKGEHNSHATQLSLEATRNNAAPLVFDWHNMTLNGSKIIFTAPDVAHTEDGRNIKFTRTKDKLQIDVDDRTIVRYFNGVINMAEPETFINEMPGWRISPYTGERIWADGAIRPFEVAKQKEAIAKSLDEPTTDADEYRYRMEKYQKAVMELKAAGVPYTTFEVGGVQFTRWANGACPLDPSLPEKLMAMDPETRAELFKAQAEGRLPFTIPIFKVENGNLVFPNGVVKIRKR